MTVLHILVSLGAKALILLAFILVMAFLGYCLYIKYIHLKHDHIPGPPRDSFFLGQAQTLLRILNNDGVIYDKLLEWAVTYGPVYRMNFLHFVCVFVTCPEATKELMMSSKYKKHKFPYKRLYSLFGERFVGNGMITVHDHELWYKQRRIIEPAFSNLYLRGLIGTFNEKAEILMDELTDAADNNTETNMQHLANCVTLEVIAKAAFGVDLNLLTTSSTFPQTIETCLKGLVYYTRDIFFEYNPKNRRFIEEVRRACRVLRATGAQWIQQRRTAMENGEDVPKDILTQIIKASAMEKNTEEDEELMLDNFVQFFIAGQETTSNQIAFCIMELGRHPEILDKARKEVDDVIGMKHNISCEDLRKLIYLSQVLKETLRIYPAAPAVFREIPEDMVIDGVHIPGGVSCMLSTYVTGRMERFFKDPLKFDPDRFHPDAPKPYYCYYPFALGPRACLGKTFAQMEAEVVMAKLLQRFDFTLVPGQSFDIQDTAALRPKSGVFCTLKPRN